MFYLPSGPTGKTFIRELTRLIESWTNNTEICDIALKALMVMPALLLQKPTRKSTAKQHKEYLKKRLDLWSSGTLKNFLKKVDKSSTK